MLNKVSDVPFWAWPLAGLILVTIRLLSFRYQYGLSRYNGPFLASITDSWRLWQAFWYTDRINYLGLPERYGKVIRLGPKTLLFSDPDAIKDIYTSGFPKSDQYMMAAGVSKGVVVPNLFSATDKEWHGKVRRSVSSAFALSNLIQYEPLVTQSINEFLHVLDTRIAGKLGSEGVIDFSRWLNYFALDIIGQLTFGSPYGLVNAGRDHIDIIRSRYGLTRYFFVVGNMTWLDHVLYKNPVLLWLGKKGWYNQVTPTVPWAQRELTARLLSTSDEKREEDTKKYDLLEKFLRAKEVHPESVNNTTVLGLTLSMVNAGSGTVATTLSAIFYHLLKSPETMDKLCQEIDTHFPPLRSTEESKEYNVVMFSEAQKLPYLDACLKETFRIHPALGGQLLERVVPPGGALIDGAFVPGGTIVSGNAWITQRHQPTFGDDVEKFRPERWLDCCNEKLSAMNRALLVFGAGPHTCIGKNIALLELYKTVPSILRVFKIQLQNPKASWKVRNLGEPHDFFVRFERRYRSGT